MLTEEQKIRLANFFKENIFPAIEQNEDKFNKLHERAVTYLNGIEIVEKAVEEFNENGKQQLVENNEKLLESFVANNRESEYQEYFKDDKTENLHEY